MASARPTARQAAAAASRMLQDGEPLAVVWRHGVVQLLDDYRSTLRHRGPAAAARIFDDPAATTGDERVDAAFAALAEHLARRDGWPVPHWSTATDRPARPWWFVTDYVGLHPRALRESPLSFRKRGVFITEDALERV